MGEVYRARDARLGRDVAIKVLPGDLASDSERRTRFEREAKAVAALDHPHICGIYDVGEASGTHYLVMPLLEGHTLAARLEKGPLPVPDALKIADEIADALDKAHRQGIVHRDLKPANVMLTKSGVKLLDFGLAKLRPGRGAVALDASGTHTGTNAAGTAQGTILGTIHYMAPEQVEGRDADHRADIWALGAVIYETVTGVRPFQGDTAASVMGAILKDEPALMSSRQPTAPPLLDRVVAHCLEKDADARWQSAADVRHALAWSLAPAHVPASSADAGCSWPRIAAFGVALMAALLVGAAASRWMPTPAAAPGERLTLAVSPPDGVRITGAVAFSPDGRQLVFVGQAPDAPPALWLRSMETGMTRQLDSTTDPLYPIWAPTGDALGFFADGKVKVISLSGGPPRVLAVASNGRGGSWGPDGTILFVPEPNNAVFRVPSAGGPASKVTTLNLARGEVGHRFPEHVDANRFIYTIQAGDDAAGVYLSSLDAAQATRLVPQYSNATVEDGQLFYVDNGAIVARPFNVTTGALGTPTEVAAPVATGGFAYSAFSVAGNMLAFSPRTGSGAASVSQWFDRSGKSLGLAGATSGPSNLDSFYMVVSRDGRKVALGAFQTQNADLWILDTDRDVASRFTFNSAPEVNPVWSPDDSQLVYAQRGDVHNVFRQSVAAPGTEERLTTGPRPQFPTDWTRDGRTLVVTQVVPKTQADLWAIPAQGGEGAPILATEFNEYAARLSPDNRWLAYTSDRAGRPEVWIQEYPSGHTRVQLSTRGGTHPLWRGDGRELYHLGSDRRVYAVPVAPGTKLQAGAPVKLFDVAVDTTVGSMHANHVAVTPDGQRFLLNVSTVSQTMVAVVQNWASTASGTR
jgi:Tol biopolymer transport system component